MNLRECHSGAPKTGGMGGRWITLERPKPPRVGNRYRYWSDAPPYRSERCEYWMRQIQRGWRPNRSIRMQGYDGAAGWYGIYIWEYLNVICPTVNEVCN